MHAHLQEHSSEMKMEICFSIFGRAIHAPLLDGHSNYLIIQIYGWAIVRYLISQHEPLEVFRKFGNQDG